ncbi:MAG: class I SAM-dependent methyltransferase [Pseudomonadota bacterium]
MNTTDRETISAYDARVADYDKLTRRSKPDPTLIEFIGQVRPGGLVLDLGCGPAASSAVMRDHGLRVDPVDASSAMVELANATHGIGARLADFGDIDAVAVYDGVWANFSLLHARPDAFDQHLRALHRALVPGGIFHIGMKLGQGSNRDSIGRFYAYYTREELSDRLTKSGFSVDGYSLGQARGLAGDVEPWITMTARHQ